MAAGESGARDRRDGDRAASSRGALAVASGILLSRLAGLVRAAATSAAFGIGPFADVLQTALRAPNVLQNLLGEQALSASFIPTYSRLLALGDRDGARRFASAAFGLLALAVAALVAFGVLAAHPIVALFSPGYLADASAVAAGSAMVDRFELTVGAVRWLFPMTGLLVLSAWALGVLNSHRRFFLPYVAPVLWNLAIVAALGSVALRAGPGGAASVAGERWLLAACVGALVGGALQLLVQLPSALRLVGGLRPELSLAVPGVRPALAALLPALAGRGVVQLSSYLDLILASFLAAGAPGALGYAQMLYLLPISLFGQSLAASALPELSRTAPNGGAGDLAGETRKLLSRTDFLVVPTAFAYLLFGSIAVAGLYRLIPGRFAAGDVALVAIVLAGYSLGLPASTSSRVLQTTFFALGDTRSPARVAGMRVALSAAAAVPLMLGLDRWQVADLPGLEHLQGGARLGAVGLAVGATLGAWCERWRLGVILSRRIGPHAPGRATVARIAFAALLASVVAVLVAQLLEAGHPSLRALGVFTAAGVAYIGMALALRLPELDAVRRLLASRR